jgi:hypothetical protein
VRPALHLVVNRPERKAASDWRESETDEAHAARVEQDLAAALAGLVDRWTERTVSRVQSPKSRKGTRHFAPEHAVDTRVGNKALDAARIVDEDRFAAEAQALAYPVLRDATATACVRTAHDLGIEDQAAAADGAPPVVLATLLATATLLGQDDAGTDHDPLSDWLWTYVKYRAVRAVLDLIGSSAQRAAAQLADTVNIVDQGGGTVADITGAVRQWGTRHDEWAHGLAEHATTAAIEGARSEMLLGALSPAEMDVERRWRSMRDDKVRPSHKAANGQKRGIGEAFQVGDALLLYPGDPAGPVAETAHCRCRLMIRSRASGRFLPSARDTTLARASG